MKVMISTKNRDINNVIKRPVTTGFMEVII